jgi:hypothetical protein
VGLGGFGASQKRRQIGITEAGDMNSAEWLAYFRQNRHDRLPVVWEPRLPVGEELRAVLGRSLAKFQLGESSAGNHLRAAAARTGDLDYAAAIELFIAEEADHARLLARVLELLETPKLRRHWTDTWCRRARRVAGLHSELAVLLAAEVILLRYYGAVRRGVRQPAIEAVCSQILHDQKFHVRFHCESLHRQLAAHRLARGLFCYALTAVFALGSVVVAWDHRRALAAVGCPAEEFLAGAWRNFRAARDAVYFGRPFTLDATDQTGFARARSFSEWIRQWTHPAPRPR